MAQLYPFTDPRQAESKAPKKIVSGEGCYVIDSEGKRYFDAVAALWCSPLGFNDARLRQATLKQMERLSYYHSFMGRTCQVTEDLAAKLADKLPGDLNYVFFASSGSEAVESASKIARFYQNARGKTDKKRFIAREGGYHGSGQMSAALTGMTYCHEGFDVPTDAVLRTGRPHYYREAEPGESEIDFAKRRARELEELILREDPGTIAAFIGEPAMGAGGVILPPEGYWPEIQSVLSKHDILLIADEIITGFGRTGRWFACETYGIEPDMMTMAKQITASYFPLSAVAMTQALREQVASLAHDYGTFGHGVTYGGHPVGAAVALETIKIYEEMDLEDRVGALGDQMKQHLLALEGLPGVGNVRSVGLLGAVEMDGLAFDGQSLSSKVVAEAEKRGVFFRLIVDSVAVAPPYITTPEQLDEVMTILRESILAAS